MRPLVDRTSHCLGSLCLLRKHDRVHERLLHRYGWVLGIGTLLPFLQFLVD